MADDQTPLETDAFELFAKYVSGDGLENLLAEEIADLYQALTGLPHEEAMQLAREKAAEQVAQISDETRKTLAKTIADSVEHGMSADEIAAQLEESIGLDRQRKAQLEKYKASLLKQNLSEKEYRKLVQKEADRLLADRAGVIAQQELRNAIAGGNEAVARGRGATHKRSISAGDRRVNAICRANEAKGIIPIDENFPSGHAREPYHVRCRCAVAYFTQPSDKYIQEQNQQAQDKVNSYTKQEGEDVST